MTELQQQAVQCGLTTDPILLSEFELHKFIKENSLEEPQKRMMHIWNAFEVFGMPESEEEQTEVARKLFTVDTYHVHEEGGRYFIVRHTIVDGNDTDVGVYKLNPNIPEEHELMDSFVQQLMQIQTTED